MYSVISPQGVPPESDLELPQKNRHWFRKIIWIALFLIFAYVIYIVAHLFTLKNSIFVEGSKNRSGIKGVVCLLSTCLDPEPPKQEGPDPIPQPESNRFDILLLGIRGEDDVQNGGLLSDSMMLLSVNQKTGKAALVSLPRDLHIDIAGTLADGSSLRVKGKLNEIYVHGYENKQGLTFTSQMISRLTGVYVDRAVLFDFAAFGRVIDALGGIDVTLAKPFSEKSQWGYEFSLPAGKNHLNGEQALYYVRSRYSSSDFDRARRQQEVIFAIKKKATELGFFANPSKVNNVISSLGGSVKTNFQLWEIRDMVNLANTINASTLKTSVLTPENLLYESKGEHGEYILLPKGDTYGPLRDYFRTLLQE